MEKNFLVECDSFREVISFQREDWEGKDEIFVSLYIGGFYANQRSCWSVFVNRLRMIWYIITGRDYRFFELCFYGNSADKFKKDMKEFCE